MCVADTRAEAEDIAAQITVDCDVLPAVVDMLDAQLPDAPRVHESWNDNIYLEREPLEAVTQKKQLAAFRHEGFWQCMDTKRDKDNLNEILKRKKIKF